jgi:hypothetical protein
MAHRISALLLDPGGPWIFVRVVVVAFAIASLVRLVPIRRSVYYGRRAARKSIVITAVVAVAMIVVAECIYAFAHAATR